MHISGDANPQIRRDIPLNNADLERTTMTSMARIPLRDTRPERLVLAAVRRVYGGPVTTQAALPGTPDFVLPELRVAIEAHGCFWHNHAGCPHARIPATDYPWAAKFARNRARDFRVRAELASLGWRMLWIWECAVIGTGALQVGDLDGRIAAFISSSEPFAQLEGREVE
ncbi:very short patch repair endonuclease, partial [Falsiroseomonas sp. E2-1-a4]|uniref:very short patch repair endonuclease n=1 Tax=Falsiroseomonas sp. E2-1-a4 TaxID=3239299 RepID=UPI003F414F1E